MGNKYDDFSTKVATQWGICTDTPLLATYYILLLIYTVLVTMDCKSDCNWLNADAGLLCLVKAWWTRS